MKRGFDPRKPCYWCQSEAVWRLLRDFNSHVSWYPLVATGSIRNGAPPDRVGCIRDFELADGCELSQQLLAIDDTAMRLPYSILTSPMPISEYTAHLVCHPVTATSETLVSWSAVADGRERDGRQVQRCVDVLGNL